MLFAFASANFHPLHSKGGIPFFHYFVIRNRSCETGPACAAVEFIKGAEERLAGDNVDVNSCLVIIPVGILKRGLGGTLARHAVLFFAKPGSQLGVIWNAPIGIRLRSKFSLSLSVTPEHESDNHYDRRDECKPESLV